MTERFRVRDALGRERWIEQQADKLLPYRPRGYQPLVEDDVEQARRRA